MEPSNHGESFPYRCGVCWWPFKLPWVLKSHMNSHSARVGDQQLPITSNGVEEVQEDNIITSPYYPCMTSGWFYLMDASPSLNTPEIAEYQGEDPKTTFMGALGLIPFDEKILKKPKPPPALDPVTTFQAWEMMKTGKVAKVLRPTKRNLQIIPGDYMPAKKKAKKNRPAKKKAKKKAKKAKRR